MSLRILLSGACLLAALTAAAEEVLPPPVPSVQDNLQAMDHDHDGLVTVYEVRALIEARHGKDYQAAVLDEMESSASGKSCSTPFAGRMYYVP